MENSVSHSWQRIEKWLADNAPADAELLASGATESEIEATESLIGVRFPDDVRQSYLLHNGAPSFESLEVLTYGEFYSLERVRSRWSMMKEIWDENQEFRETKSEPDFGVKDSWWNPGWVSFCDNGSGNDLCIDLDPAEGGTYGQIIERIHDESDRSLLAPSFAAWLSAYADALEDGELGFDPDLGVMPIGQIEKLRESWP